MGDKQQQDTIEHLAQDLLEMAAAAPVLGLKVLQAEMQALAQILPGAVQHPSATEREVIDAQVEAEFDNMPL